jgi:Lar family restriction alleviation protein
MSELKKCPFCGDERHAVYPHQGRFIVCCRGCGVKLGFGLYKTEQEAVEAWNKRADDGKE